MRRRPLPTASDLLWAASTEGVVRAARLVALGVPEKTVYRRCRTGGPWQLLAPGVLLLHTGTPTVREREIAVLVHGGPEAMLTGASAARHHGLRRGAEGPIVALVPAARRAQCLTQGIVERTWRLPTPLLRDGLPVAPLPRAVCDEVRRLRRPTEIAAVLTEPVQRRMVLVDELGDELDAGCRKGTAIPRRVLRAVRAGVLSPAEYDNREWWLAQPELPEAEWNVVVHDLAGRVVGVADALVRSVGFVWEIDSVEQHFATPEQVAATMARRRAFEAVGLHLLGTRPSERRDDPEGVKADILRALVVAATLPAPAVIYGPLP